MKELVYLFYRKIWLEEDAITFWGNLYFAWEGDIYISGNNQLHHLRPGDLSHFSCGSSCWHRGQNLLVPSSYANHEGSSIPDRLVTLVLSYNRVSTAMAICYLMANFD